MFFLPYIKDEYDDRDLPAHPGLRLVANSNQVGHVTSVLVMP